MIKIKGHSNFKVEVKLINGNYYILKSSNAENSLRLEKQIKKQKMLFDNNFLINCNIPEIYKKEKDNDRIIFRMEYVKNSINMIDFLSRDNNIKVDWLLNNITTIIDSYINKCESKKINITILKDKITNIIQNISNNLVCKSKMNQIKKYLKYINTNIHTINNVYFPVGICHGDMTFSNILIDTNNMELYLIDFLDSFIESPLFDIIKIRQDTCFNWTINMCDFYFDKNKTLLTLNYIDYKIDKYFCKYVWYKKMYKYFQILNILRIIQYCKNNKLRDVLIRYLEILY